ncbi:MAG: hypothetical protein IJB76_04410 [Clostridia bacterium]|nr:hypothetical protein [Clostridia bacterium]
MKKRTVAILMACTLILGATVGVTFAWLISGPKAVVNTFVAGKVAITLDEAEVNKSGTAISSAQRVQENEYTLIPGHSYDKDPTVHIEAGSEPCYVFVKVQNGISTIESSTNSIERQMTDNGWEVLSGAGGTNGTVYYFKTNTGKNAGVAVDANGKITVRATGNPVDLVVFESFTIDGTKAHNNEISALSANSITVTAYAIQALGSTSAADAWTKGGFN